MVLQEGSPDASYSATFASPNYTATGIASTGNFTLGDFTAGLDQLAFTTAPQTLTAGVTSGTITVQLQDAGGTPKRGRGSRDGLVRLCILVSRIKLNSYFYVSEEAEAD